MTVLIGFLKFTEFFIKANFQILFYSFAYFYAKLQKFEKFFTISFFSSSDLSFESKFCLQFLIYILPLGSGSVDLHIFANPDLDPGNQNLVDLTDPIPNPKH